MRLGCLICAHNAAISATAVKTSVIQYFEDSLAFVSCSGSDFMGRASRSTSRLPCRALGVAIAQSFVCRVGVCPCSNSDQVRQGGFVLTRLGAEQHGLGFRTIYPK